MTHAAATTLVLELLFNRVGTGEADAATETSPHAYEEGGPYDAQVASILPPPVGVSKPLSQADAVFRYLPLPARGEGCGAGDLNAECGMRNAE